MVLLWPPSGVSCWVPFVQMISSFITTTKEKNEDEDCDYEMVWDAEGSMHLVKKAAPKALGSPSSDTGSMGRCICAVLVLHISFMGM